MLIEYMMFIDVRLRRGLHVFTRERAERPECSHWPLASVEGAYTGTGSVAWASTLGTPVYWCLVSQAKLALGVGGVGPNWQASVSTVCSVAVSIAEIPT